MKKILLIALTALSSASVASAQTQKIVRPPFYTVTSPQGKVSYLLGTIHYGIGANEMPPKVMNAFKSSKYHIAEKLDLFDPLTGFDEMFARFGNATRFKEYLPWMKKIGTAGAHFLRPGRRPMVFVWEYLSMF